MPIRERSSRRRRSTIRCRPGRSFDRFTILPWEARDSRLHRRSSQPRMTSKRHALTGAGHCRACPFGKLPRCNERKWHTTRLRTLRSRNYPAHIKSRIDWPPREQIRSGPKLRGCVEPQTAPMLCRKITQQAGQARVVCRTIDLRFVVGGSIDRWHDRCLGWLGSLVGDWLECLLLLASRFLLRSRLCGLR